MHVVLLGDSIFDNAAYVGRGEEVLGKLRARLPEGWQASLEAVDGAVIEGVVRQIGRLPPSATHILVSAGGNDALRHAAILRGRAGSIAEALGAIAEVQNAFAKSYRAMLDAVAATGRPFGICTIYDAQLPDPLERRLAATALSVLNDVITRQAAIRRLPLIDLRVMFNDPGDYANSIEPSGHGGDKIAAAIAEILASHDFAGPAAIYR